MRQVVSLKRHRHDLRFGEKNGCSKILWWMLPFKSYSKTIRSKMKTAIFVHTSWAGLSSNDLCLDCCHVMYCGSYTLPQAAILIKAFPKECSRGALPNQCQNRWMPNCHQCGTPLNTHFPSEIVLSSMGPACTTLPLALTCREEDVKTGRGGVENITVFRVHPCLRVHNPNRVLTVRTTVPDLPLVLTGMHLSALPQVGEAAILLGFEDAVWQACISEHTLGLVTR